MRFRGAQEPGTETRGAEVSRGSAPENHTKERGIRLGAKRCRTNELGEQRRGLRVGTLRPRAGSLKVRVGCLVTVLVAIHLSPVSPAATEPSSAAIPKLSSPQEKAEKLKEAANELFLSNKFKESILLYTAALREDPQNPAYLANRAFAHIKMENYGQALEDSDASIALDKNFLKAYYRRGAAQLALGRPKQALKDFRAVAKLRPSDNLAQAKVKQCEKLVRLKAFEVAIRSEKFSSPFETLRLEELEVDEDYDGPRWEDDITEDFVLEMLEMFKNNKRIHRKYAYKILVKSREMFMSMKNVVELSIPKGNHLTVCGDTHGQFYDLLKIFEMNDNPSADNPYIFNGDFVDRGSWSLEVIMTLLAFKCLCPESIHLTRGNHETMAMNKMYGFEGEVTAKYSRHMYDCFTEVFWYLPLAITLNSKVFICHGGLFRDDRVTLEDINKVNRAVEPPDEGIICDLLWSDPQEANGRAASKRGTGGMFGPDVTEKWLRENKLDLLVRSHEMKEDGYDVQHNGKCITIFSAPNYCDQMGNLGAYIKFGHDCQPRFTRWIAVDFRISDPPTHDSRPERHVVCMTQAPLQQQILCCTTSRCKTDGIRTSWAPGFHKLKSLICWGGPLSRP